MPANFHVVLKSGPNPGKIFPLEKAEIFIGRDLGNDIVINDPEVSRRHARLYLQNSYYVLEDMGSTNGSSVNGQRLSGPYLLRPGEMITFGERVNLLFEAEAQAGQQVTESPLPVSIAQPPTSLQTGPVAPPAFNPPPQGIPQAQVVSPQPQPQVYIPPAQQPVKVPPYSPPPLPTQYDPLAAYPQAAPRRMEPAAQPVPFSGQVPMQPAFSEPEIRYRIPIWIFIVLGVMAAIILILLIDDFRLWCPLFGLC